MQNNPLEDFIWNDITPVVKDRIVDENNNLIVEFNKSIKNVSAIASDKLQLFTDSVLNPIVLKRDIGPKLFIQPTNPVDNKVNEIHYFCLLHRDLQTIRFMLT